jgi:hypothetical protein
VKRGKEIEKRRNRTEKGGKENEIGREEKNKKKKKRKKRKKEEKEKEERNKGK